MPNLTASHLSRVLHDAGFRPLPSGTHRSRYGMRVMRHPLPGHVAISVDLPTPTRARRVAADVVETLEADGYVVEVNAQLPTHLTISRPTA